MFEVAELGQKVGKKAYKARVPQLREGLLLAQVSMRQEQVPVLMLFAAIGMGLGGWLAGAVYDMSGSYAQAFVLGFGINIVNLVVMGSLAMRYRRVLAMA